MIPTTERHENEHDDRGIIHPDPSSAVDIVGTLRALAESADDAIGDAVNALLKVGSVPVTAPSSGIVNVSHTLGRTPVFPDISLGTRAVRAAVTGLSDTTLTVHLFNATTGANFTGNIVIRWLVA